MPRVVSPLMPRLAIFTLEGGPSSLAPALGDRVAEEDDRVLILLDLLGPGSGARSTAPGTSRTGDPCPGQPVVRGGNREPVLDRRCGRRLVTGRAPGTHR